MKRVILIAALACLTSGSVAAQQIQRMPFPEALYAAMPRIGTSEVRGQAFLKTIGGEVKLGAGNTILLHPVTPYSIEYHDTAAQWGQMSPVDQRMMQHVRSQVADAQGNFTFRGVPPGEYFLGTHLTWQAPTGYRGRMEKQGGMILKRIMVGDGQAVQVVLTQ